MFLKGYEWEIILNNSIYYKEKFLSCDISWGTMCYIGAKNKKGFWFVNLSYKITF